MRVLATGMMWTLSMALHANAIQLFTGLNYANPAELFKVKESEFILGSVVPEVRMDYRGYAFNVNTFGYDTGHARTLTTGFLPYGRFARRINSKLVVGVDVTEPYYSNIDWGDHSVLRFVNTQNLLTDADISPRASFAISPTLYVGAGVNVNLLRNTQINFAWPTGPVTYGNMINKMEDTKTGYDLGVYYMVNQTNFVGFSYYSAIRMKARGTSYITDTARFNQGLYSPFTLPETATATYTHLFSKTWLANLQVFYSNWTTMRTIDLYHTAAGQDFHFPSYYNASVAVVGLVRHQYNEKLGLALLGAFDSNPAPDQYRSPALPSDNQYVMGIVGDYQILKNTNIQLLYGHGTASPLINMSMTLPNGQKAPLAFGHIDISANVVDLRIKVTA